ncbi:MAG TPA: hypothetical protein VFS29_03440 [Motilibacteraceae bacterium]|nr:hypothetical protein [Motilibacteraceae bacterium]
MHSAARSAETAAGQPEKSRAAAASAACAGLRHDDDRDSRSSYARSRGGRRRRLLVAGSVTYQINGGWAVDALAGTQTRPHRDLDRFVDVTAMPDLLPWLESRGYVITEDWGPLRVELASATGRVDVHPMTIQSNGDGIQQGLGDEVFVHPAVERTVGVIGGREVVVATPARLRELRTGYELRPVDHHDLGVRDRL